MSAISQSCASCRRDKRQLTIVYHCDTKVSVKTYPICLVGLGTRQAVVIGGGVIADRKVEGLLAAGAQITLISPALTPELRALAETGVISAIERPYQHGDLKEAFLVIAATDDPETNQAIWSEALARGCLINVVDDPQHSNFIVPAIVRRGEMNIAISTGGSSPALARRLRERIEAWIGPEYGLLADLLAELRPELIAHFPPGEPRLQAALRVVDSDILEVIRRQGRQAGLDYARAQMKRRVNG